MKGLYVGRRLSYDGHLCTVRYIGPLTDTKGDWLGVEWDDITRGKHNGQHQGRQIFSCLASTSSKAGTPASFIRPTRTPDEERTVLDAIKYKYGTLPRDDINEIVISGKIAEKIGFEKIARQQSQLSDLRIVLLDGLVVQGVSPRGVTREQIMFHQEELRHSCPNVTELDAGYNVIEKWNDVARVCVCFPKLQVLRAGGLRFHDPRLSNAFLPPPFPLVRTLHLSDCLIKPMDVLEMLDGPESFPCLHEISLSGNALNHFTLEGDPKSSRWPSVRVVMLEENNFTDLACLKLLTEIFPNLTSVSFRDNQIATIGLGRDESSGTTTADKPLSRYTSITSLNLAYNNISDFAVLDSLPDHFPNLNTLQISNNSLYTVTSSTSSTSETKKSSDANYYLSLARIPGLEILNYTTITPRDREEGELYYLSTINSELESLLSTPHDPQIQLDRRSLATKLRTLHPRYDTLCSKYDRPNQIALSLESQTTSQASTTPQSLSFTDKYSRYPPGSIGHKLIKAHFYIPPASASVFVNLVVPRTIPTTSLCAILQRTPPLQTHLRPLQYKLIYESAELDPVDTTAEGGTKSTLYARQGITEEQKRALWEEWGDWDADAVGARITGVDGAGTEAGAAAATATTTMSVNSEKMNEEHWIEDRGERVLIRDGRRWKRREVEILKSVKRAWGDWIESDVREITVRIEPYATKEM